MNEDEVSLGIYVPSYGRYNAILTQDLFEECTYVVRKSEEELYRQAGVKKIWAVEDELINSGVKAFYYIAYNAPEDIIFIADDDIKDLLYRTGDTTNFGRNVELIMTEVERIAQLLYDLKVGYACIDATAVPYNYDCEFGFKGTSGSIKWVNREVFKAKIDESVTYNYDMDLVLQELLYNRIVLKPKYLCAEDFKDTNEGGESNKKRQHQIDSVNNMKLKWGRYFDYNFKNNKPRINVPR